MLGTHTKPSTSRLPFNWRDRLPRPAVYYQSNVDGLAAQDDGSTHRCNCPFHDDVESSLKIDLAGLRGVWKCSQGCGAGDMIAFVMRRRGVPFPAAVRELMAFDRERHRSCSIDPREMFQRCRDLAAGGGLPETVEPGQRREETRPLEMPLEANSNA